MVIKTYSKVALSVDAQIDFLICQGLLIEDRSFAKQALSVIGYYRFSAYLLPFKESREGAARRSFKADTTFEHILNLYMFDRELKRLVIDAIERIEIAFRAAIANATAIEMGPFWYTDRMLYRETKPFENLMRDVNNIVKNKHELFIEHYYAHYNLPSYPPIWMMMETLSFGACSKIFSNLKHVSCKKKICELFLVAPTIMDSWLKMLVYVRNICAHHGRLWNRWLVEAPIIPKKAPQQFMLQENNRQFIACAYVISCLLSAIAPEENWSKSLQELFSRYPEQLRLSMGFSKQWDAHSFEVNLKQLSKPHTKETLQCPT
ncbi:MAG: Abi family protein [Gammaproteobacteria bacterium]|nr:Abi family protein [Gammaproteobacteria bacterium]